MADAQDYAEHVQRAAMRRCVDTNQWQEFDEFCAAGWLGVAQALARLEDRTEHEIDRYIAICVDGAVRDHVRRWSKYRQDRTTPIPSWVTYVDEWHASDTPSPETRCIQREDYERLLGRLRPRHAWIIDRLLDGAELADVGMLLGVTASRICQLKKEALHALSAAPSARRARRAPPARVARTPRVAA